MIALQLMKLKLTVNLILAYFLIIPFFIIKIIGYFYSFGYSCNDYNFPLPSLSIEGSLAGTILLYLIFNLISGFIFVMVAVLSLLLLQVFYGMEAYRKVQDKFQKKYKYFDTLYIFISPSLYYNLNYLIFC